MGANAAAELARMVMAAMDFMFLEVSVVCSDERRYVREPMMTVPIMKIELFFIQDNI